MICKMNTLQINQIIEKDFYSRKYYLGTVALDQLSQYKISFMFYRKQPKKKLTLPTLDRYLF